MDGNTYQQQCLLTARSNQTPSFTPVGSVWKRLEGNATEALARLRTAQKRASAVAVAEAADLKVEADEKRETVEACKKRYVEAAEARGAMEAAEVVGRAVDEFQTACGKVYLDQLTRDDMTKYHHALRKRGLADRTVSNRHINLRSFILFTGLDADVVCGPAPRYEEQAVEIYEHDELEVFFESLTEEYDKLLFDTLLQCGLREQEAEYLEWPSINSKAKTLRVQSNERYGFKTKDAEQRDVALSEDLLARLLVYKEKRKGTRLVFGNKHDKPEGHMLRKLKKRVRESGLNCGHCATCISTDECGDWYLHKFRATYITTLLRNGVDIRTVMKLSGHSDLESIMRYLRPAEGKEVQDKVNSIKWR
jgi:integrase